ncbi:MAG: hypothetical protein ABI559_08135 [Chloroflexota bacterium]
MCQFGTALRSLESAGQAGDFRTLHVIESALQVVAALELEAELHNVSLKEYLRHVRHAYLEAATQASRSWEYSGRRRID